MANLRDIRRRIKSVKNTAQITRAMQLVAAAKMKKAQDQALAGREYAATSTQVLFDIRKNFTEESHPLLEQREGNRELVLVISTDKGLCGRSTPTSPRSSARKPRRTPTSSPSAASCASCARNSARSVIADFTVRDPVPFRRRGRSPSSSPSSSWTGNYDKVSIAFTSFVNTLRQEPEVVTLLPIQGHRKGDRAGLRGHRQGGFPSRSTCRRISATTPSSPPRRGARRILPLYVNYEVFQAHVEARASEHSARMVAMKSATDNAKKFIKELTLEYNKLRQGAITAELLEITTA
jgi:F-type H+-transporting ATPase subunit gamma